MGEKTFGFWKPTQCYHISKNCPVIKNAMKRAKVEVREYQDVQHALDGGHIRRCRMCMGEIVFTMSREESQKPVRMTNTQHRVLGHIVRIWFKTKRGMTLRTIGEAQGRSIVATYLVIEALIRHGLVTHEFSPGSRKAKDSSIVPTKKGLELMLMEADN